MKPLASLDAGEARGLAGLLFDLDDTLLSHGVLERAAYDALWDLRGAGLVLVAVTGRPSGWGEILARQWPIEGAVTENGAVHVVRAEVGRDGRGGGVAIAFDGDAADVAVRRARLDALVRDVARAVPHARLSDDVPMRRTDVAWDIGERERLDAPSIDAIAALAHAAGARTTRSSVHLHATYERDDKASGAVRFLATRLGVDAGAALHRFAFVGDSGNDAACFGAFRTTFGVANVRAWIATLSVPPRFVSTKERGEGFAEIAAAIRTLRAS